MTTFQILSLVALAVALLGVYGPTLLKALPALPASKPQPAGSLRHIEAVVAIRDSVAEPEVIAACNSLLAVLLKVKA